MFTHIFPPQLQNLDLRKNRLSNLDALKDLHEAAHDISTLHLGENSVSHIMAVLFNG